MKKPKYSWNINEPPPLIDPHSKNKHSIYAGYLRRYVKKLTQNPRHLSFKLFIVDGFCGGGVYKDQNNEEHLGSPFIIFSAINEALVVAQESRINPIDASLHYYFVDKDNNSIEYLKAEHKKREINFEANYPVHYFNDKFESAYINIIKDIKKHAPRTQRVLFILDQCGWAEVPVIIINDIFQRISDAEIILTFTPDEIIDYASEKTIDRLNPTFKSIGLDIASEEIIEIRNSETHTDKWISRMAAQELIANTIKNKITAPYFTRYYIKSVNSHRSLMLIHLSQHQTAHNEMMEEHWNNSNINLNHQGYTGVSPLILGYNYRYENEFQFLKENFFERQEEVVVNAMMQQIPLILSSYPNGVPFELLMHTLRCEAPITKNIMKKTLDQLIIYKQIDVINHKNGHKRNRCTSSLHMNDQIKLPNQQRLFI